MDIVGIDASAWLLLVLAAFAAGVLNAVAGGGSFLTFPALVFTGVLSDYWLRPLMGISMQFLQLLLSPLQALLC